MSRYKHVISFKGIVDCEKSFGTSYETKKEAEEAVWDDSWDKEIPEQITITNVVIGIKEIEED